ncbi:hypothetical protein EGR_04538 [Echinococcus granulosus]|uniref:Uncharacterized protein n=1 Tax=Echinococcus granulosus TaxID=6210 RepID=W6UGQ4_ECHGR|nr:hypothetical protein EGR_04538 [Echinococcus granulosus]EUB60705.1 hypothetical protein EGR_04538 [Echinococcus granulosus]
MGERIVIHVPLHSPRDQIYTALQCPPCHPSPHSPLNPSLSSPPSTCTCGAHLSPSLPPLHQPAAAHHHHLHLRSHAIHSQPKTPLIPLSSSTPPNSAGSAPAVAAAAATTAVTSSPRPLSQSQ